MDWFKEFGKERRQFASYGPYLTKDRKTHKLFGNALLLAMAVETMGDIKELTPKDAAIAFEQIDIHFSNVRSDAEFLLSWLRSRGEWEEDA